MSLDDARDALRAFEDKFQQLWDPSTNSYRHYSQHSEKKSCPTQYIALEQLRARFENNVPLLVGVAAPAGYGKSQLIQAWLVYLQTRAASPWSVLAMTGVAASNAGGTTLHAFFQLRRETGSGLYSDKEAAFLFQEVPGLIIDEAYMSDQETLFTVIQICAQLPLLERLRRPNALPLFGYRDVFLLGDLRQLPPATGNQPFWATETFQDFFEIMVLREDRRHEKDAEMRALKELLAWGGCEHTRALCNDEGWEQPWPIDDRVRSAILDMTLQGIGLSGHTVDPDVGTAIFARHVEKDMWNDAYVHHIERLYWDQGLEAVDVVGFNPVLKESKKEADTRRSTGLQAPRVLKLRTCPQHRLRTVMLHNENVLQRWCNGTPCRLLACNSWTGSPGRVTKNPDGTFAVTRVVHLEDTHAFPEFNVKVIRDENSTLAKEARCNPEDICVVPSRHDSAVDGFKETHFQQVSLALAAAMTCHKVQGLTIPKIYFCLHKIFGFGIPYTAFTRTPLKENIAIVGVPPRDIYAALFRTDDAGQNMLDRKKSDLAERLRSSSDMDESTRQAMQEWHDRLDKATAVEQMLKVCARFKRNQSDVQPWVNAESDWKTLQAILQGDADDRRRILFFRDFTVGWMEASDVDMLAGVGKGETRFARRSAEGRLLERRAAPQRPEGMEWRTLSPYNTRPRRMQEPPSLPEVGPPAPDSPKDAAKSSTQDETTALTTRTVPNPRFVTVAEPSDDNTVQLLWLSKKELRQKEPPAKRAKTERQDDKKKKPPRKPGTSVPIVDYPLYFESQTLARCGMHALNNVLGVPLLSATDMSQACDVVIAESLVPDANGVLPDPQQREDHEYPNSGWYSAAVMEMALRRTFQFELRLGLQLRNDVNKIYEADIVGAISNKDNMHWVAIKVIDAVIWMLDSCHKPLQLTAEEFLLHLNRYPHTYAVRRLGGDL